MEIITAGSWMVPTFVVAAIVGIAAIAASAGINTTWLRIPLIILGTIITLTAVGSLGFAMWGKYLGFPWHFTAS